MNARVKPLVLSLLAVVVTTGATAALAGAPQRTLGAAKAAFQAGPTGGVTVFTHNPTSHGVPAGAVPAHDPQDIRIYPLFDGAYCASGWHLLFGTWWDDQRFWPNRQALFAYLSSVQLAFALDGVPLETERTAIKRFVNPLPDPSLEDPFAFNQGAFLAPGTLTVGVHSVEVSAADPVFGHHEFTITVTVLPC